MKKPSLNISYFIYGLGFRDFVLPSGIYQMDIVFRGSPNSWKDSQAVTRLWDTSVLGRFLKLSPSASGIRFLNHFYYFGGLYLKPILQVKFIWKLLERPEGQRMWRERGL